jgi:hypothetical protein
MLTNGILDLAGLENPGACQAVNDIPTSNLYEYLVPDCQQAAAKLIDEITTPIPVDSHSNPPTDQPSVNTVPLSEIDKHG